MKILFVVSEVEGLAKTGGLADVAKALPMELKKLGHEVIIVMPYYKALADKFDAPTAAPEQLLYAFDKPYHFNIRQLQIEDVAVFAIDHGEYFQRSGFYTDGYHAYPDNAERFAFFADAALTASKALNFQPDIVHCNDWHTALTPYFMRTDKSGFFNRSKSVLTIHNGAFQGTHRLDEIPYLKPHTALHSQLDGDAVNFLRIGLRYANKINTVSPNYANELLTTLGSHMLYNEFQARKQDVSGILNGCDYSQWDPATDALIPQNFDVENPQGKTICKNALQERAGFEQNSQVPLIGMVCRLTEQKGFGYILPIIEDLMQHNVQLLIIGTGDPSICEVLHRHAAIHPGKFVFIETFSDQLAHLLEAGSDFFLMPSLFEPCGLNQMYSLAYGTLPIVRAVGGLKDTVIDLHNHPDQATGFVFEQADSSALLSCILRALLHYYEYPQDFAAMKHRAMQTRFTWQQAAIEYQQLYQSCL
ncbi:glycogen synthase GlgA [Aliiglaciecola sp. LCG003]|uniref:glycogen synthase GlgA n=1 Tax=Aliiglaciecola sp. LCG003 TaxID=3053655 RepID=UPI0025740865|nr:glycogen synthase GlgA [Aliiglaciecola sp. LCG003]WJG09730.1 glycogen synthase GlgA [Aliiglaciecola sp. LCG003]